MHTYRQHNTLYHRPCQLSMFVVILPLSDSKQFFSSAVEFVNRWIYLAIFKSSLLMRLTSNDLCFHLSCSMISIRILGFLCPHQQYRNEVYFFRVKCFLNVTKDGVDLSCFSENCFKFNPVTRVEFPSKRSNIGVFVF